MTTLAEAWQQALAAEQQAVYGYSLVGPHLGSAADSELARTCQTAHEVLRDRTATAVTASGGAPRPPLPDYPSLYPVSDAKSARKVAIRLEQNAASTWRYLYAVAATGTGPQPAAARTAAQAALIASAVRATRWRRIVDPASATVAFPGI